MMKYILVRIEVLFAFIFLSLLVGCGGDNAGSEDEVICLDVSPNAIDVVVRDSQTLELLADYASGYITDGSYVEDLEVKTFIYNESEGRYEGFSLSNTASREGTYDVFISVEGYTDWETTGVVVNRSECNVETVRVEAFMEPE